MPRHRRLHQVEDYEPLVGAEVIDRVRRKAEPLRGSHVTHINSTFYGGGVAELLSSLTLLMNSVGIRTGWRAIHGPPDFFSITKKMHNALQGDDINLTEQKLEIYEDVIYENAVRNHLDHDFVIVHDPQPLPLVTHYRKRGPWVWRCHIDLTDPHPELWDYLVPFVERYDAVILSLEEYARELATPQRFIMPAIDPFTIKNRELSDAEIENRLTRYHIPRDLPLVVQVSRFDRWKDPVGVIDAFRLAQKEVDARLVLLGNVATDDPEGEQVYQSLRDCQDDRIIVLSVQDSALVNALQRCAAVVLQKSIREGFGLTVAEAMWKGAAVVGGNVGGIRRQIEDGVNGFLVSSVPEAARRIVQLVEDEGLRKRLGERARQTVRDRFLLVRLLEEYLDLFNSFETVYRLRKLPAK
jgi:trehalose synthase